MMAGRSFLIVVAAAVLSLFGCASRTMGDNDIVVVAPPAKGDSNIEVASQNKGLPPGASFATKEESSQITYAHPGCKTGKQVFCSAAVVKGTTLGQMNRESLPWDEFVSINGLPKDATPQTEAPLFRLLVFARQGNRT